MTIIGFIRHGVTAWNKEGRTQGEIDIPLDEEGVQMAYQLRQRLQGEAWSAIYTSPLQRARQTAMIIAHTSDVKIDHRLKEIGEGQRAGTTVEERIEKWGIHWQKLGLDVEEDERVLFRGMLFVEEMKRLYPNEQILIVSHGSFIKRMVEVLCPNDSNEQELDNASLTIVKMGEHPECLLYNCIKHLTIK